MVFSRLTITLSTEVGEAVAPKDHCTLCNTVAEGRLLIIQLFDPDRPSDAFVAWHAGCTARKSA